MRSPRHVPPRVCPVCAGELVTTRLTCSGCGTELSGEFRSCEFCALAPDDRDTLRVFLASRGNMREVERHLGVSYPTARARFDAILVRLGIERQAAPAADRVEVLRRLARGELDVDGALAALGPVEWPAGPS